MNKAYSKSLFLLLGYNMVKQYQTLSRSIKEINRYSVY
jgi:hypothetical protein